MLVNCSDLRALRFQVFQGHQGNYNPATKNYGAYSWCYKVVHCEDTDHDHLSCNRQHSDQHRPLCVRLFVFARIFKVLTRFPSHTVGPRVYPGCGLVRRGMQKTLGALLSWRFLSQRNSTHAFLVSQRTSATARPMVCNAISQESGIEKTSMSFVCYAKFVPRHTQAVPPASVSGRAQLRASHFCAPSPCRVAIDRRRNRLAPQSIGVAIV